MTSLWSKVAPSVMDIFREAAQGRSAGLVLKLVAWSGHASFSYLTSCLITFRVCLL